MEKRKEGREKESYMKEKEGRKKVSKGGSRTENVLTLKKLEEGEGKTKQSVSLPLFLLFSKNVQDFYCSTLKERPRAF